MSENDKTKDGTEKALAYLKAHCAVNGIAALNFSDGEMFMISREKVNEIIKSMDEKGADEAILYVQHGPRLRSV